MDFVYEFSEIIRKYRKTESSILVAARTLTLTVLILLTVGYLLILVLLVLWDKSVITTEIQYQEILPIPDGTQSEIDICTERCITQPKCMNSTEDGRWYGHFTVNPDEVDVNFNKTAKRYGIWVTINIDDPRYTRGDDKGMYLTAYDSDFNPRTVDIDKENMALKYDPDFYNQLNQSNFHIIGFHQVNWMFVNRHIKQKMIPNGLNVLGAPASYFDMPYITTKYESVTNPATTPEFDIQPVTGPQLYSNLFIGTLNWYQEIHKESRSRRVRFAPVLPWGVIQTFFMKRQIKESLYEIYKHGFIPLIDEVPQDVPIEIRIKELEKFLKQFICEVDYMEDVKVDESGESGDGDEKGGTEYNEKEIDDSSQCTSSGNKNYFPNKLENNNNDTSQSSKSIITSHKSPSTPQNALKYLIPNLDFIPINKITSEEIKELGKYHPMMSPVKKRKFDHFEAVNSWRKPNVSELPWMKDNDCNRKYDNVVHRMHFELNDLIEYLSPTEIERSLRIFVIKRIEAAIKSKFSDSEVFIFGSFNSGIYLPTSSLTPLSQLADYLEIKGYSYGRPTVIRGAVVPIIKFKEKYTEINIDISFNQRSVFASVSTIKGYLREWPILGRLLLVLKYFLKHHNLDDPSNGGMGGYTLFCMILNFLQLHPRIADGTLKIDSNDNLGVLLIEFFELYGNQFNYKDLAITIRNGGSYCRKYYQSWAVKIPETNLSRATRKIELIQEAFNRAFLRLVNRVGQLEKVHRPIGANYVTGFDNKSILSSILFISEDMQSLRRNLLREYNENGLKRLVLKTSNNLGTLLTTYDYEFIVEKFAKEIEESDYRRNFRVNSLLRRRKPARFKSFPKYQDRDDYYLEDLYD
ncbi:17947_t:CDS:10 [Entrophospora sp. SA101]|nr:17947_t:CDS:10 [Entrophospora sp. SA101]